MDNEKGAALNKWFWYVCGILLIVLGLILLIILKKMSGYIFPDQNDPVGVFLIAYGAILLGIIFAYVGSRYAAGEARLLAIPVLATTAKVLNIDNSRVLWDGTILVLFEMENGQRTNLIQKGNCTYMVGESGRLKYKGDRVVSFDIIKKEVSYE